MIKTIEGKEEFINFYQDLGNELKSGDFYYTFAFQNEYQSEEIKYLFKTFHLNIAKKGIDDRAIFNEKLSDVVLENYKGNDNIQIKFKDYDIPVGLIIMKDRVLQLGWKPEPFIVEIQNKHLYKYYYNFFMNNWNTNQSIEFAKEVLGKLKIKFDEESLMNINNRKDNIEAIETANEIEKLENSWEYEFSGKTRQFGQKVIGETIKLWSVPRTTAELLEFLVVATNSKNILEIGTSAGYSTLYLAMGAKYNNGKVYTIEKLKPKADFAKKNFTKSKLDNIELLEGDAFDYLAKGNFQDIDLIFLDADKENYGKYFDLFMPYLKRGGLIVADNIFDYGHMMQDFLNKVLGTKLPGSQSDKRVKSYTLPLDNGVLITKKVSD